jgi:hypothetical protein
MGTANHIDFAIRGKGLVAMGTANHIDFAMRGKGLVITS